MKSEGECVFPPAGVWCGSGMDRGVKFSGGGVLARVKGKVTRACGGGDASDVEWLKRVARRLLSRVEAALEEAGAGEDKEVKAQRWAHERVFGTRASLTTTLVLVAELLLKLGGMTKPAQGDAADEGVLQKLSEEDVALVEAFVRKMEQAQTP